METITIRKPDDWHVHLRQGKLLKTVLPHTARYFGRALVMPNTQQPILSNGDVRLYRKEILDATKRYPGFAPLMTIKITDGTTPATIKNASLEGDIVAGKLYPAGVTTNSDDGVTDFKQLYPVFQMMQEVGMVLSLHGEMPGVSVLDAEEVFVKKVLPDILENFPHLKVVLEHITTSMAVYAVFHGPENLAATITPHHVTLTIDDVIGEKIQPHHFCKPVAKSAEDRNDLEWAVMVGSDCGRFFLGTDSAPHPRSHKQSVCGSAGIFNAPVALSLFADIFTKRTYREDNPRRFEKFVSVNGARFYGLPVNTETITLVKKPWKVPKEYGGVVPFMAGKILQWQIAK